MGIEISVLVCKSRTAILEWSDHLTHKYNVIRLSGCPDGINSDGTVFCQVDAIILSPLHERFQKAEIDCVVIHEEHSRGDR